MASFPEDADREEQDEAVVDRVGDDARQQAAAPLAPQREAERQRQQEALDTVEDFYVNHLGDEED